MLQVVAEPDFTEQCAAFFVQAGAEHHSKADVFQACESLQEIEGLENVADGTGSKAIPVGFRKGMKGVPIQQDGA